MKVGMWLRGGSWGWGWGAKSLKLCLESCGPFDPRAQWEPHLSLASLEALTLSEEGREWWGID